MNKERILGLARHILTFMGGILIAKGIVDETTAAEVVGAIVTLIGGVWSVLDKN